MDPIQKLYENRNKIRENNLKKDIEIWKYITQNITEKDVEYQSVDTETIKFSNKDIRDMQYGVYFSFGYSCR